jgi:hypothetical protein
MHAIFTSKSIPFSRAQSKKSDISALSPVLSNVSATCMESIESSFDASQISFETASMIDAKIKNNGAKRETISDCPGTASSPSLHRDCLRRRPGGRPDGSGHDDPTRLRQLVMPAVTVTVCCPGQWVTVQTAQAGAHGPGRGPVRAVTDSQSGHPQNVAVCVRVRKHSFQHSLHLGCYRVATFDVRLQRDHHASRAS